MKKTKAHLKNFQNESIYQKLEDLENKWETYKQTNPRPHLRRCSTGGYSDSIIIRASLNSHKLLENSPRSLMSSLQENRRRSSPALDERFWKVRTNDIAMQEILTERRAALVSGKLRGRRLFGGLEDGDRQELCSDCFDLLQESEVRSVGLSYATSDDDGDDDEKKFEDCGSCGGKDEGFFESLDDSCLCEEKMVEGEKVEMMMKEKKRMVVGSNFGGGNGGRWMLAMAWFAMVTMVLTLGLISMSCNGGNLYEEKVILIPT